MRQSLLTELPGAPRIVASVADSGLLAVACDGGACFLVPLAASRIDAIRPVCELATPAAGAGGWGDRAYFVEQSGRIARVELASGVIATYDIGPCRRWIAASSCRRSARIVPARGALDATYRSDRVEVWDEEPLAQLATIDPETRDCFEIDAVALAADGRTVALTGLDVYYTADGDWGFGQDEVLIVAALPSGRQLLDLVLDKTSRPSDHEPIPIALTDRGCFAGGWRVEIPEGADAASHSASRRRETLPDEEPWCERVTHLAALDAGRAAAVVVVDDIVGDRDRPSAASRRVVIIDVHGTELADAHLPGPVTTLTAVGSTLIAGCADGRLVLLHVDP